MEQSCWGERIGMWCSMAGTLQLLACPMVAICLLLPEMTATHYYAGQPMDSTNVGGGLQEPEALEVMFEVFPPSLGHGGGSVQKSLSLGLGRGMPQGSLWGWEDSPAWVRPPAFALPPTQPTCSLLCSAGPGPPLTWLLLQLLWAGLELDVTGQLHIQDEELASTRPGRRLRLLLQYHVPSDLQGAEQRLQQFQDLRKGPPLSPWDFEHLLLTGLSCVYRLHAASEAEERGRWAQVFILLAQETLWDLCKGFCPQGQPPSLVLWASVHNPSP
ncbi:protein FAM180B [Tupaia chinensis]|uniref:Protein FAM180B n=1 Tax=Tupaia chinensis TaxID=246437 RepID=L9JEX4_TUPCH|nr:protein FAM180B [Tupaia chinensis]ELW48869.1 Protein FAM180B [Tupaia chinensis]